MTSYRVNEAGVKKANAMIEAGQYDLTTEWGEGQPSAADGNAQIERHGYDGYGEWHLAVDTGASGKTKDRYSFPYGDFRRVFRSALIHAKQRAVQNGHDRIAETAGDLLDQLDAARS